MVWKVLRWPFAIIASAVVIVFVLPLVVGGARVNLGGILGSLFGKKREGSSPSIAVSQSIPKDRHVLVMKPDAVGFVQVEQAPVAVSRNPFRDKSILNLPSGESVKLPEGVHDGDVESVILIKGAGEGVGVKLKDSAPASPTVHSVDALIVELEKLGSQGAAKASTTPG